MPSFDELMACTRAQVTIADEMANRLSLQRRKLAAIRRAIMEGFLAKERNDPQQEQLCRRVDGLFLGWKEKGPDATTQRPTQVSSEQEALDAPQNDLPLDISAPETLSLMDNDESRVSEELQTNHDVPHLETSNETGPSNTTNVDDLNLSEGDITEVDTSRGAVFTLDEFAWSTQHTPSRRTIKAKFSKATNTFVAIETSRRELRTTSEFMWDRERRTVLRGDQAKGFSDWFTQRKPVLLRAKTRTTSSGSNTPGSVSSASPQPSPDFQTTRKRLRSTYEGSSSDEETLIMSPAFKRRAVS